MNLDPTGTRKEHLAAATWCVIVAAIFLAPMFSGKSFSVVEARQHDVYPWAADVGESGEASLPAQFDSADLTYPWQLELQRALDDKTLAFWSPNVFGGGAPLYANATSGQLYPPRAAIYAVTPERWTHDIYVAFHLVLGGFVTYLLCRELKTSALAGAIAATAWMLGSFNLAWIHLEVVTSMLIALPLAPLLVHRLWRRQLHSDVVLLAVGFAMMLISGHMLWQLLIWMVGAGYAAALGLSSAFRSWRDPSLDLSKRARRRVALGHLVRPPAAFALGVGLAAVVLIPSFLNLSQTPRSPFVTEALPAYMASARTFSVELFTGPSFDMMTTDVMNYQLAFAGTLTAALALIGVFTRRSGSGFARTVMAVTAGVAVIGPLARIAYELVPGMNVFYPYARLAGWFALGLVVAAAIGFDTIADRISKTDHAWGTPALGAALCVVTVIQLVPLGHDLNPPFQSRDDDAWFPETPLVEAALRFDEQQDGNTRIAAVVLDQVNGQEGGPAIFRSNHPSVFGLDTTSGYDSTLPGPAAEALRVLAGQDPQTVLDEPLVGAFVPNFEIGSTRFDLMRSQGINAVVTVPEIDPTDERLAPLQPFEVAYEGPDGNLLVLRNADGVVSIHDAVQVLESDLEVLNALDAPGDVRTTPLGGASVEILVTDDDFSDAGFEPGDATYADPSAASATIIDRGQNSIDIETQASNGAWLLLAINNAPGWSATVNGEDAKIVRAQHSHMAIRLFQEFDTSDQGSQSLTVSLRYRPPGLVIGSLISLVGLLICGAIVMRGRNVREKQGKASTPDGGTDLTDLTGPETLTG